MSQQAVPITAREWDVFLRKLHRDRNLVEIPRIHWLDAICLLQLVLLLLHLPLTYWEAVNPEYPPLGDDLRITILLMSVFPLGAMLFWDAKLGWERWTAEQRLRRYLLLIVWLGIWGVYCLTPGGVDLHAVRNAGVLNRMKQSCEPAEVRLWAVSYIRRAQKRRLKTGDARRELAEMELPPYIQSLGVRPTIRTTSKRNRYVVFELPHGALLVGAASFKEPRKSRDTVYEWSPGVYTIWPDRGFY